jgi:hypothetical protein
MIDADRNEKLMVFKANLVPVLFNKYFVEVISATSAMKNLQIPMAMAVHFQRLLLLLAAPIALGEFATTAVFVFLHVLMLSHTTERRLALPNSTRACRVVLLTTIFRH